MKIKVSGPNVQDAIILAPNTTVNLFNSQKLSRKLDLKINEKDKEIDTKLEPKVGKALKFNTGTLGLKDTTVYGGNYYP